jgi:hypothetical protein
MTILPQSAAEASWRGAQGEEMRRYATMDLEAGCGRMACKLAVGSGCRYAAAQCLAKLLSCDK